MAGKKAAEQQMAQARDVLTRARVPGLDERVQTEVPAPLRPSSSSALIQDDTSFEWLSALYRSIVETCPDAITVTSADGKIVFCNQQAAVLYGFERTQQMMGRDAWDFVALEDRKRAAEDFRRMQAAETIRHVEYTLVPATGERVPVELSASAVLGADGKPRAFIGIVRDVSERRRSEEALRGSEEYFRKLIENAPDLITVIEASGEIRYQSPAIERTLGYKAEELVGTSVWQLLHPEDVRTVGDAIARGLLQPALFEPIVFRARHKDGAWRFLQGTGRVVVDDGDRPYGVINSRDLTENILAAQALEESEKRKAAILETALDAIITMDRDGNVVEFNPAAEGMFGYTAEEAIGKPLAELIVPPSLRAKHRRGMARYLESGRGRILGRRVELAAMRSDDTEFPVEIAIVPIQLDGSPIFTGYVRDLTERKRWEEELQQAREELENKVESGMDGGSAYGLTFREMTVLHLVAGGRADKEIAVTLGISPQTVNKHVARILNKMRVSSRTEAVVRAMRDQIVA